jgi:hypothetical protein
VRVDNPLDEPAEIDLVPRLPEGVRAAPPELHRRLRPKEHARLPLTLIVDSTDAIEGRAVWTLDTTFEGERLGEAFEGMLEAPGFAP